MATEIESAWSPAKRFTLVSNGISGVEQAKLMENNGSSESYFGHSVSVSSDGSVCVIGVPSTSMAYIYRRQNNSWSKEVRLTPLDEMAGYHFGYAVAISGDGNTAAVFSFARTGPYTRLSGHIRVYVKSGSGWVLQTKLLAPTAKYISDQYHISATLNSDGNTLAIGHVGENSLISGIIERGGVYIYVRTGTVWAEQAKLILNDDPLYFGRSVSLSNSGNDIAIGGGTHTYVFTRSGNTWSQQARLTASDGASNYGGGSSVSISGDGKTVLSGYPITGTVGPGAAFVFTRSGVIWSQHSKLMKADGHDGDYFGNSVSINDNGSVCAVGAYLDDVEGDRNGSVTIFKKNGSVWERTYKLFPADVRGGDAFGYSVSLSRDGKTCVAGSRYNDNQFGDNSGAAYVFV